MIDLWTPRTTNSNFESLLLRKIHERLRAFVDTREDECAEYKVQLISVSPTCRWRHRRGRSPHGSQGNVDSGSCWRQYSPCKMGSDRCTSVVVCRLCRHRSMISDTAKQINYEASTFYAEACYWSIVTFRRDITFIRWTSNLMFLCSILPSKLVSL